MDQAETQDSEHNQLLKGFAGPHGKRLKKPIVNKRQPGLNMKELTKPTLAVPPMILGLKRQQCREAETRHQISWHHVQMEEISTQAGVQDVLSHHFTIALHMKTIKFQKHLMCDNSKLMKMPTKTSA
jgi:hypothetical protein